MLMKTGGGDVKGVIGGQISQNKTNLSVPIGMKFTVGLNILVPVRHNPPQK